MNNLGINLKNRRLELDMTLVDLAKKIGLKSPNSIAKIERGDTALPHIDTLERLSKALTIPIASLLGIPPISADTPTDTLLMMGRSLNVFLAASRTEFAIDNKDEEFLRALAITIPISGITNEWWEGELRNFRKCLKFSSK